MPRVHGAPSFTQYLAALVARILQTVHSIQIGFSIWATDSVVEGAFDELISWKCSSLRLVGFTPVQVFSKPSAKQDKEESWMEAFYRTFHSKTQHVRAVVVGYKHDACECWTCLACFLSSSPSKP